MDIYHYRYRAGTVSPYAVNGDKKKIRTNGTHAPPVIGP